MIRDAVALGRQAYIVYPLVNESDKVELKAAVIEAETLRADTFKGLRVGLLHGQMKAPEKEAVMRQFRDGALDILIATSIIEVGIDVPNATVIAVQHAERFGLATLHQLRGAWKPRRARVAVRADRRKRRRRERGSAWRS